MSKVIFGIDIGGTTIKCGYFQASGKMIKKEEIPTRKEDSGKYILKDIAEYIKKTVRDDGLEIADIAGVGMGVPGSVRRDGTVNKCVNLGWGVFNVAEAMAQELGTNKEMIAVGNDANVAALGEFWKGGGEKYNSIMMVTIGTGVGGGLIIDGEVIGGFNGAAAEIGHMPLAEDIIDYPCNCGKTGCLEQIASATGIARLAGTKNAKEVFDRAKAGDQKMEQVVNTVSMYLGKALACVAGVADPECFVIGGGVSAAGDYFLDRIRKYYKEYAFHPSRDTKIVKALLGNDAGMYGAVRMILNMCSCTYREDDIATEIRDIVGNDNLIINEPMKQHTTFKIGGPADFFITPETEEQLKSLIEYFNKTNLKYYIVGNGSNILVSDEGIRGAVIQLYSKYSGYEFRHDMTGSTGQNASDKADVVYVNVLAGMSLIKLANEMAGYSLSGLENLSGIPGTIGGAVCMNAGAYGSEIKDVLVSARLFDKEGYIHELNREQLNLGYRKSIISDGNYIVSDVLLALRPGNQQEIRQRMQELVIQRKEKQPLEYPSAGSTFKRPEGNFAGKLIADAGLKGYGVSDACVSEKHAGFVINKGNATAKDVEKLIDDIKNRVKEVSGVTLETEVKKIGF